MADGSRERFTKAELLAVLGSRLLEDGKAVFAGVGTPLLAAALAQQTRAPHLTIVVEGGIIRPEILPGRLPISTNEMRAGRRAVMLPGITDTFLFAQRGFFDYGFLGGAQIDRHGNINTSVIGPYDHPKVRLPGSGGAADIIALCTEVLILTLHEKRRFVERVDFVTSPAYLDGGDARRKAGLLFGRVSRVVTDLAVMGFDPTTKAMRVEALHPSVTLDDVRRNTGFELGVADPLGSTDPPTETELRILRQLDPDRRFLG